MSTRGSALERIFQLSDSQFSEELAAFILALDFPADDHRRYEELSAQAQTGSLGEEEKAELEDLLAANDLLMILQSKARLILKHRSPAA